VLVGLAAVVGLIALLNSREKATFTEVQGPGQALPDQGRRHLEPGQSPAAPYASDPPTSGPHVPVAVTRDGAPLSDDQILQALEAGNVILLYGSAQPPPALRALADDLAGPFDPELAKAGQAVILARRPGTRGVVALAWRHLLRVPSATDPALRTFTDFWLGRPAPEAGPG
jgi:hypothetical protein